MNISDLDHSFMRHALRLADKASAVQEVPVGAVVVRDGVVVGEGWNQPLSSNDPTAHAEIMALRDAGVRLGNYRLPGCDLYVTLEPCVMCAGAIVHARINRVIYGATDPKAGGVESVFRVFDEPCLNHHPQADGGLMAGEAASRLQAFFAARR